MLVYVLSYSLGDAIDWKLHAVANETKLLNLLLARGCDRLETSMLGARYRLSFANLLLARGCDRLETHHGYSKLLMYLLLLLARGCDRLETKSAVIEGRLHFANLLLARGCDRLETNYKIRKIISLFISYSLGDAIDWKLYIKLSRYLIRLISPTR